ATKSFGFDGGEPSIAFDKKSGQTFYATGGTKVIKFRVGRDGKLSKVTDATPPVAPDTLDTIMVEDQKTGRLFVSYLALACSIMASTDDASESWQQSEGCGPGSLLDHQSVGAGPLHAPLAGNNPLYDGAVYYCAQNSYNGACSVSLDGGRTFGPGVPVANTPANNPGDPLGGACSALHGHVRVGPDGTAYLPLKGCGGVPTINNLTNSEFFGGRPSLSVSEDNGATWQVRMGPGDSSNPDESDPSVAAGPKGTLYSGWQDGTHPTAAAGGTTTSARVATSKDNGRTWSKVTDLSTPLGLHNVQFPEMIVGDDNRAAFSFIATPGIGNDQDNAFRGSWHLYISMTYDTGKTWTTVDATPTDPVNRGCVHMLGIAPGSQRTDKCDYRNMLDFNDITLDQYGRVEVAYTDACEQACKHGEMWHADARDVSLAHQVRGKTLYAKYDDLFAKR
ncbi:MAG: hypothetical protein QOE97_2181, partial [Pseudonocardiales bacterium]|nr:hypothetical protein [Pseudonocardiales bacterium]